MINYTSRIKVSPKDFKMTIDDEPIPVNLIVDIGNAYEIMCTAEFILNNYSQVPDEETAWDLASDTRRYMNKYDISEMDAIDLVISQYR